MADVWPTIVAGAFAGCAALAVFVVLHAIWIVPIWGMLGMLPVAALVGALAAWPFETLLARGWLPPPPFDGIAFALVLLLTLVPTALFGVVAGPLPRDRITATGLLVPLALAMPAGAAIGLMTGGPRSALALGVAAGALAITLGHNLPFFPLGSPGWEKAFGLILGAEIAAGAAFGLARAAAVVPLAAQ